MDPSNPYSSPPPTGGMPLPTQPVAGMDYMRMITYVFENPNWFMNLFLAALCSLIPIIGGLVVQGYHYEAAIQLISEGGRRYPDFDFGRFGDYLMRGLWPFLVGLAFIIGVAIIAVALIFIPAAIVHAVVGEDLAAAVGGLMVLMITLASFVLGLFLQPMLFRAALTLDFSQAFQFDWVKDFVSKVWLELILGFLFLAVAANILTFLGILACCVGVIFVGPILLLAHASLLFQVYSIYLSRGGTPVPIRVFGQPTTMGHPI
jgi:hypothetical protein